MKEKVKKRSKKSFSNHWLIVRLNLRSDDVRNCEETTTLVEERNPQFGVQIRTFIWRIQRSRQV